MTPSKKENNFPVGLTAKIALAALTPVVIFVPGAFAQSDQGGANEGTVNYQYVETHRVIKLQEENRFLLQRLRDMKEKTEALQAELLSVRNAYLEREDIIPRTQQEISERYQEKISALQEEIRRLRKELEAQRSAYEALDEQRSKDQDDLSAASRTKSDLQATLDGLRQQLASAQEQLADQEKKYVQGADELSRKEEERRKLQEQVVNQREKYEEEIRGLNDRLARLKKEHESLADAGASSLKASQQEGERAAKELQEKIGELTKTHAKEIQALSKDNEGLQARLKEAQERVAGIESGREKLAAEVGELRTLLGQWQAKADGLEADNQSAAQRSDEMSAQWAQKEREFQASLAAMEGSMAKAAQEHAKELEQLRAVVASKEAELASARSHEQEGKQELARRVDELEGKLVFSAQQLKELQQKEAAALEAAGKAQNARSEELTQLQGKIEELRNKLQEGELELTSAQKENELLLTELLAAKDERIRLDNEISELNKAMFDLKQEQLAHREKAPSPETEEVIAQLTRQLLESENNVYEKELIIEGLRGDQQKLKKALDLAEGNYAMLKAELEGLKVNEVSYKGRENVLDLELDKLEERVERRLMGR